MDALSGIGRLLIVAGLAIALVGAIILVGRRLPGVGWLGRLPGDFVFQRGSTTVFVQIVTSIVLSVVLTVILNLIFRR